MEDIKAQRDALALALRNLLRRLDEHFEADFDYTWVEKDEAEKALALVT